MNRSKPKASSQSRRHQPKSPCERIFWTGILSRSSQQKGPSSLKLRRDSLRSPLRAKTGGKGIRTPDLLIANETLYQLSYTPNMLNMSSLCAGSHCRFSVLHTDLLH